VSTRFLGGFTSRGLYQTLKGRISFYDLLNEDWPRKRLRLTRLAL
jgi:hypothetical protein